MIGLRIPGEISFIFSDPHFAEVVQGVADACNEADYGLMLMMEPEDDPVAAERIYQRVIRGRHIDGVILSTSIIGDPFAGRVAADGMPAVMIGRHPALPTVDIDNVSAACEAVSHLVDHRYRQIAHIRGPRNIAAANERAAGYERALSEAGIPIDPTLIEPGDFSEPSGYLAMRQLLDRPDGRPDAVFAGSDTMAAGAMRALHDAGITVPDDIGLMGFDGLAFHTRTFPTLSTLAQSATNLGRTSVELLLRRISDPDGPPEHVYLGTELLPRGSCGCGFRAAVASGPRQEMLAQPATANMVESLAQERQPAASGCL
jgi:LacI family transcriptional regulator